MLQTYGGIDVTAAAEFLVNLWIWTTLHSYRRILH